MTDNIIAEKLNLGIQIAGFGLGEVDYIADTITLDDRAAQFFALPANEPVPRILLHDRIHPEDKVEVERQVNCLLSADSEGFIVVVHRVVAEDLEVRWLSARKQVKFKGVLENGDPRPVSGLVAIQDITEHKEAEAHIQYLMGEVAHRSKNMLSVVQGIARLTARNSDPQDFMRQFSARLAALGANQAVLVDNQWTSINVAHLARTQLEPYISGKHQRVIFKGPHIVLKERAAQSIGMALHELATNAVKYGALSNSEGTINISWNIEGTKDKEFVIQWVEEGGPRVSSPKRKGFGETVIRQMASSSVSGKVTLEYDPSGVSWSLTAPSKNVVL